ncbi:MAG: hypothetical protein ACI3ZR_05835 [bacterium]
MAKYRKKMVVEAEIYRKGLEDGFTADGKPFVKSRRGKQIVEDGDYIVSGIDEKYPVKTDVFEKTYELIKEEE